MDAPDPSILTDAARIVDGDRERTYGDPGRNLRTIANLWDSWLLARGWSGPGLSTDDVACLMTLLKLARLAADPTHRDSQVDVCGYMRLLERTQAAGPGAGHAHPPPPGGEGRGPGAGGHSLLSPPSARADYGNANSPLSNFTYTGKLAP
jgi:hypothetical protein